MGASSFIFFGLLLIPLVVFLVWIIKQDKKRNYLGLIFLLLGIFIAAYTIIKLDSSFLKEKTQVAPKPSSFR